MWFIWIKLHPNILGIKYNYKYIKVDFQKGYPAWFKMKKNDF